MVGRCGLQTVFAEVSQYTAVDMFRHYELWRLALQMGHIDGDFLEVGVWTGGTGVLLAHAAARCNASRIVHLCDTFEGIVKAGEHDPFYKGGEFSDTSLEAVQARVDRNNLPNVRIHRGMFPDDTASKLESLCFSLIHIDVDVYQSARQTFEWAWPKVSVGGAVVFDDYGWVDCAGVIKFVNEDVYGLSDGVVLHNLNGHAVVIKTGRI
ncbi:TylF/MycF/NovP-related O-methyltransferase [Bosea sp. EC-HK365B]|uniref:TylF/MycF/NovP-related O-methyltransferase n=2 Tax=unclassified Bosea (in: a-proteobacteria) TaxID=2653178 RepID=UPI00125FB65E